MSQNNPPSQPQSKWKKNWTHTPGWRRFGYPVDFNRLENSNFSEGTYRLSSSKDFLSNVIKSLLRLSHEQGTALSEMVEDESNAYEQAKKDATIKWLSEAMARLPKNQEVCIFLKFGLDTGEERTEAEVADITLVSQSTVHRNIERGFRNLRRDCETNLVPIIKQIKTQFDVN